MIDVLTNVAPKGFGPHVWQSRPPREVWGHRPPVSTSPDLARVLALPRRAQELDGTERAEAIIDVMTERFARRDVQCRCAEQDPDRHASDGCLSRLRLVQALALREIGICGGLLGPIGVGHGKTLINLLAPLAFAEVGINLAVLLVPPGLVTQLINDYEYAGQHFYMPQIVFHGNSYSCVGRGSEVVPLRKGAPVLHVVPYSRLSRPEATTWLEQHLQPQAIIADEVHRLRDMATATTSRVARYMNAHPQTRFAGWSGGLTSKSLREYAHLAAWALRGGSPLPLDPAVVDDWCRALDPGDDPADPGPLIELCEPGEPVVSGYRRRLAETIGVVTTTAPAINVELAIEERPAPEIPKAVREALASVRGFVRPDGEELVDALSVAKAAREVACGFYYKWVFPHNVFPRDLALVEEWLEARKEWHKELREKLRAREEHLDSPLLCQHAAERAHGDRPVHRGLPTWRAHAWPRWRDVRGCVRPETETVRVDDYLARDAAAWALSTRGIVWYEHHAFGAWVSELSGLPIYGGGVRGGGLLDDDGRILEDGSRSVVLSIKAHGVGRNGLQSRFCEALVGNPPASATGWEQVAGRLHRLGQKAPAVRMYFYKHTRELAAHVDAALRAALYVEGTLGSVQKLTMGFKLGKPDEVSGVSGNDDGR